MRMAPSRSRCALAVGLWLGRQKILTLGLQREFVSRIGKRLVMTGCAKQSTNATIARRAALLDRCDVCVHGVGRCPIGPEWRWRGWDVLGGSVQVIEHSSWPRHRRWVVVRLHSGRLIDRCYPVRFFPALMPAKLCGFDYALHLVGGGKLDRHGGDEDWIARGPRGSELVLIVRRA